MNNNALKPLAVVFALTGIGLLNTGFAVAPDFIPMDESMQRMIDFYRTDTIVVLVPDNYSIKEKDIKSLESFVFWEEGPQYIYKSESQLQKADLDKHLQFFGPLYRFKSGLIQDIPFRATEKGFVYRGRVFEKSADSFYYMHNDGKRIYTCRNGENHPLTYVGFLAGGAYQLYVFTGNQLIYSGFDPGNDLPVRVNDLDSLRAGYFCHNLQGRFFTLNITCSVSCGSIPQNMVSTLNTFVENLCIRLEIDTVGLPNTINYFYSNREDLQYFIAAPFWQTVYGRSYGNINHITGFDLAIFKHEIGHSIINCKFGENPNPFFMEGFRQYTDYFFSRESYVNDVKSCTENMEMLTVELVNSSDHRFFNSMVNYSISGIFTKYLIDRAGFNSFKEAYSRDRIIELILTLDDSLEIFIAKFGESLKPI